jgi:hypothetical protein
MHCVRSRFGTFVRDNEYNNEILQALLNGAESNFNTTELYFVDKAKNGCEPCCSLITVGFLWSFFDS